MSNTEQSPTTVLHESAIPAVGDLQGQLDVVEQRVAEAQNASFIKRTLGRRALAADLGKRDALRIAVFNMKESTDYHPWLENDQNEHPGK